MKTLLRIDASARLHGSHSRALADHFQQLWLRENPDGRVITRDLAAVPVPHLDNATIAAFTGETAPNTPQAASGAKLSDQLIAELESADQILVSSPLYNFNMPSSLKAYIDHVVRFGHTFGANKSGYFGLLRDKRICLITTKGGLATDGLDGMDFQGPSVKAAFEFMGLRHADWIALEGTNNDDGKLDERKRDAHALLDGIFNRRPASPDAGGVEWRGDFSELDRTAINALRAAQVQAILAGDAESYAQLCTNDILLMLQGFDVASGREQFLDCERRLFQTTKFNELRQIPLRVERQGNLAVESGRQESSTAAGSAPSEFFKSKRKYTHVLRKTAAGWRFAVLMSNNSL